MRSDWHDSNKFVYCIMPKGISLLELQSQIKGLLNRHMAGYHWVVAEIASMQIASQGHCYMELVEQKDGRTLAKARANIWASQYGSIASKFLSESGESLKTGITILCAATINFHEVYGLSLNIASIDASYTLGERARKREETIQKLILEGLSEMNKALTLPAVIQNIAVISSATAAGYEDFINQLTNNAYSYKIVTKLFPAVMQGNEGSQSISSALSEVTRQKQAFDAIVIIRGGGSQLDLDCFDDYELAKAIATCPLPVLTGIGHQRDHTVADFAANLKLKTPTAVAEFILERFEQFESELLNIHERIRRFSNQLIHVEKEKVSTIQYRLLHQAKQLLSSKEQELSLEKIKLQNSISNSVKENNYQLDKLFEKVQANDPASILRKGYSITTLNNIPINQLEVKSGDELKTISLKQTIYSKVYKINPTHEQ